MIDLKTGYMLGLAAELGALCAGADREQTEGVRYFGCLLGRAFQLQDDLLEIFSDASTMGKSLGSDIVAEKKTYLMIAALDRVPEQVRAAIQEARTNLEAGLASMRKILEAEGIRDEAEERIRKNIDEAKDHLKSVQDRRVLEAFAEMVLRREN